MAMSDELYDWSGLFNTDAEQLYLSCISISGAQDEPQSKSTKPSSRFEALSELFEVLNKSVLLGDINSLQSLATDFPGIVPQFADEGVLNRSLLHIACLANHTDIVSYLLEQNCNPNHPDDNYATPMHYAAEHGRLGAARVLVERSQQLDAFKADLVGRTPLHLACENGHHNVTDFLLSLPGAAQYMRHQDAFGRTPLHYAAMNGSKALIQILFKCPSIAEAFELQDDTEQTPLDWAVGNGNSEVLILLQEAMYA